MAGTPRVVTVELSRGTSGRVGGNVGRVVGCEPACPAVIKAGRGVWDGQCVAEHCVRRRGLLRPPPPRCLPQASLGLPSSRCPC